MGSFIIQVISTNKQRGAILLKVKHMFNHESSGEIEIQFGENLTFYSFGRRKNNNFSFDDEHLSTLHAKIFMQRGEFVIEDMNSTNG